MKYKGVKMMKNEMKLSMDAISENEALGRICIATFLTRLHPTLEELEDVKTACRKRLQMRSYMECLQTEKYT